MKKVAVLLLAVTLVAALAACERRDERTSRPDSETDILIPEDERDEAQSASLAEQDPAAQADAREAELTVRDCMAALKTGTPDNISLHIDYDAFLGLEEGQSDINLRALLKRLEYEIKASDIDGDFGVVTVEISNIDMNEMLSAYLRAAMDMQYENALSDSPKSDELIEGEAQQLFMDFLDQYGDNRREATVEIAVSRIDGWWKLQPDEALRAAVFGDYFEASKSIGFNAGGGQR